MTKNRRLTPAHVISTTFTLAYGLWDCNFRTFKKYIGNECISFDRDIIDTGFLRIIHHQCSIIVHLSFMIYSGYYSLSDAGIKVDSPIDKVCSYRGKFSSCYSKISAESMKVFVPLETTCCVRCVLCAKCIMRASKQN